MIGFCPVVLDTEPKLAIQSWSTAHHLLSCPDHLLSGCNRGMVVKTAQRRCLKNSSTFFMPSSSSVAFPCHTLHKQERNVWLWLWEGNLSFLHSRFSVQQLNAEYTLQIYFLRTLDAQGLFWSSVSYRHYYCSICESHRNTLHFLKLPSCIRTMNPTFGRKSMEYISISRDSQKASGSRQWWLKWIVFKITAILSKLNNLLGTIKFLFWWTLFVIFFFLINIIQNTGTHSIFWPKLK